MKKFFILLPLLASSAYAEVPSSAVESVSPYYVTAKLGASMASDLSDNMRLRGDGQVLETPVGIEIDFQTGFNFGLILGYQMDGYRLEGELSRFSNAVDSMAVTQGEFRETSEGEKLDLGRFSGFLFMVNGIYDFKKPDRAWSPYIGLGLGMAAMKLQLDDETFEAATNTSAETQLASQVKSGVNYAMDNMTLGLELQLSHIMNNDYRLAEANDRSVFLSDQISLYSLNASVTYAL